MKISLGKIFRFTVYSCFSAKQYNKLSSVMAFRRSKGYNVMMVKRSFVSSRDHVKTADSTNVNHWKFLTCTK